MSITAISFYWRNDTPSFVNWRSRLATAPDTPTCIVIYGGQFTGGVNPQNQFVPKIASPLPCSPVLVRHTLLIVYFFKEIISFIGSLDKCHTSVFNALIQDVFQHAFFFKVSKTRVVRLRFKQLLIRKCHTCSRSASSDGTVSDS